MSNKTLLFISTHIINKAIISEYKKMSNIAGYDSILVIDNSNLKYSADTPVTYLEFYGQKIKCFLFDEKINKKLALPMLAAHKHNPKFKGVMWANADYRLMYVREFFPNYDFYWQFEYDVFCNGKSYEPFLEKYNEINDDLIIAYLRKTSFASDWRWVKGVKWLYKEDQLYSSLFPVCRMSGRAIDFLRKRRIECALLYNRNKKQGRYPFCELFVPSELMSNNFVCSNLEEPKIKLREINLNEERIFIHPDNRLYHPIKTKQDSSLSNSNDNKKYTILQKLFSVSKVSTNSKKYKQIYFMFFKINIPI